MGSGHLHLETQTAPIPCERKGLSVDTTTNRHLETAIALAAEGIRICWVNPANKRPYPGSSGVPAGTSATATTNEIAIGYYARSYPDALPAIVGGSKMDHGYLSILDIDPKDKKTQPKAMTQARAAEIANEIEAKFPGLTKFS